ncbi:hypothetical protein HMPREF1556_00676 [Porphyromonas sp. oral taxon 278 str. W7784]|nr:hypothetical protein HMPREF1556_00676 [Porphyromonas sp. oral taxon 278 str. W7784]
MTTYRGSSRRPTVDPFWTSSRGLFLRLQMSGGKSVVRTEPSL